MEERSRRRICRAAFGLIVLAPCLGLAAWAGWRASMRDDEALRWALRHSLGVDAQWERLVYPGPGELRIEGLELLDPRGGATLATFDALTVREVAGLREASFDAMKTPCAAIPRWSRLLGALDVDALGDWRLGACEVQLVDAEGRLAAMASLSKAESWTTDGVRRMSFRLRLGRDQQGEELKLDLDYTPSSEGLRIALDTGKSKLPLRAAGVIWSPLDALGRQATFLGSLRLVRGASGWDGTLQGELDIIDLEELVTKHTKQRLRGIGTLRVETARIADGKVVAAQGSFGADDGMIGVAFLQDVSGAFQIGCKKSLADRARRDEDVAISEIQFRFLLQNDRLTLTGASEPGKALVRDAEGTALLSGPQPGPVSPRLAVSALFPTSGERVAAAQESLWLADWFRLPSAAELAAYQPKPAAERNPVRSRENP